MGEAVVDANVINNAARNEDTPMNNDPFMAKLFGMQTQGSSVRSSFQHRQELDEYLARPIEIIGTCDIPVGLGKTHSPKLLILSHDEVAYKHAIPAQPSPSYCESWSDFNYWMEVRHHLTCIHTLRIYKHFKLMPREQDQIDVLYATHGDTQEELVRRAVSENLHMVLQYYDPRQAITTWPMRGDRYNNQ
ncbi:hypothetical protein O0I10_012822 [Lichtheimia ornata]|uniref:Uncharacterized protein n=1 Tax=Lichtheimia ornata TaxID=688661 RepID=A0AAD7UR94_9FUNG|nr:uncharacterized protein O0I10_012822 [Lichtheimia ornata]KAJ8651616.1 hypothetical protein O0I10_012822 [Lichtheimia ornata]